MRISHRLYTISILFTFGPANITRSLDSLAFYILLIKTLILYVTKLFSNIIAYVLVKRETGISSAYMWKQLYLYITYTLYKIGVLLVIYKFVFLNKKIHFYNN